MWEHRGQNDCTRSTAVEWTEDEYRKALAKITTATFTSFDAELQPFSEDKPAHKRCQKISNHLPPLAGKEPPEMIEGEEIDEGEEVDDGDRTESDSETQDFVRCTRGSKRRATSLSQSPPEEGAMEEEEETTSPPEGKAPAMESVEPRPKRLRQTVLEGAPVLQRPLKDALDTGERVGPGMEALPTMKARQKVLKKPVSARGEAETKAAGAKKAAEAKKAAADPADMTSSRGEAATVTKTDGAESVKQATGVGTTNGAAKVGVSASAARAATTKTATGSATGKYVEGDSLKALAEARTRFVKESMYREADFRATEAEAAAKRAKSEIADLTKVLKGKGKELEDVIAEHQGKLAAALQERDVALTVLVTVKHTSVGNPKRKLEVLKVKHAEKLATEKEASAATILTVQKEKTSFESFVREMSRRLLVFKAVTDVPAVVDWLRRSSCRVGITMALSMVLAHYSEGFDMEEVTAGFPSKTDDFDVAAVLRLMYLFRPDADRVLATADLETHIVSQTASEDAEKEQSRKRPKDFPAERLFHAAATKTLSTYPVVKYTPKFFHGDGGAEPVVDPEAGPSE
ncbi:hypothetical protein QYE76_046499 [Lolium multiflorum]|uniref:Uncharacterized protein n=1 Tax=Lolium multiflorum TaxID=4521 RepID=A0AAD8X0R2_LOLMU|nr:hypothetical protein QYE76_046499 [Lolium multiflorum]